MANGRSHLCLRDLASNNPILCAESPCASRDLRREPYSGCDYAIEHLFAYAWLQCRRSRLHEGLAGGDVMGYVSQPTVCAYGVWRE